MQLACPYCSQPLDVPQDEAADTVACRACGEAVSLPATEAQTQASTGDHFLSAKRVQQLSAAKRAVLRQRSYAVVMAGLLLVLGLLLVSKGVAILAAAGSLNSKQWALLLLGVASLFGVWSLIQKARRLTTEYRKSALSAPPTPPNFEPLSDGSQVWKNLNKVR